MATTWDPDFFWTSLALGLGLIFCFFFIWGAMLSVFPGPTPNELKDYDHAKDRRQAKARNQGPKY